MWSPLCDAIQTGGQLTKVSKKLTAPYSKQQTLLMFAANSSRHSGTPLPDYSGISHKTN